MPATSGRPETEIMKTIKSLLAVLCLAAFVASVNVAQAQCGGCCKGKPCDQAKTKQCCKDAAKGGKKCEKCAAKKDEKKDGKPGSSF
jgi:hypothetical protein